MKTSIRLFAALFALTILCTACTKEKKANYQEPSEAMEAVE